MGLDVVEFVMAVEESFQIAISDEDAQRMITPGDVVNYVIGRVGQSDSRACLEQRAFYKLRRATMQTFAQPRSAIKPGTRWDDVLPPRQRRHNWHLLHQATGTPHWPRLTIWAGVPEPVATISGTARYLAERSPGAFKFPNEGWSRQEVEATMTRLMREQLAITEFHWDQEFVKDLGLD
jgi:hypothetical protein